MWRGPKDSSKYAIDIDKDRSRAAIQAMGKDLKTTHIFLDDLVIFGLGALPSSHSEPATWRRQDSSGCGFGGFFCLMICY